MATKATLPSLTRVRAITNGRKISSNDQRQDNSIPVRLSRLPSPIRTTYPTTPHDFQTQTPSSISLALGRMLSLPDSGLDKRKAMLGGPDYPITIYDDEDETYMAQ